MSAPLTAAVIVASNRAAAGVYADTTGPIIVEALRADGWTVGDPVVVPDGQPVADTGELVRQVSRGEDARQATLTVHRDGRFICS